MTTGSGTFLLTGQLLLQSSTCSLNASIADSVGNFVQGQNFQFTATDSGGSQAIMTGTLNPSATNLTDVRLSITGGSYAGLNATGTFGR